MSTSTKAAKTTRKVNQMSEPDVEKVELKELDQNAKNKGGHYVGSHTSAEREEEAKKQLAKDLGKNVTVQTVSGGDMHYFAANKTITGDPTVVPDSNWLRYQIEQGRIKEVK